MDMFMDKLAQKLTAQEMIKANMEADTEQLNKLKGQVKEYSECLEQVQKLTEAGIAKINQMENDVQQTGAKTSADIINALEKLEQRLAAGQDGSDKQGAEELAALKSLCTEELAGLKSLYTEELTALKTQYTEALVTLKKQYAEELIDLKNQCAGEITGLMQQNAESVQDLEKLFAEKLEASDENVHKECVKVYRNVQAAVVEENNKQTDNLAEVINTAVKGYRGKLNAVLSISIISMILALGSAVLHILQMMNFKFF